MEATGMWWGWLAPPSVIEAALYAVGWCVGLVGYLRATRLSLADVAKRIGSSVHRRQLDTDGYSTDRCSRKRPPISVVIPCRNEADNLCDLLADLHQLLGPDDEIIVVDDDSRDETADVARHHGAFVLSLRSLPQGWAGKPHACWQGARMARHGTLVFLDADIRFDPTNDAFEAITVVLDEHPDAMVSVLPWHDVRRWWERLSLVFNAVSALIVSFGRIPGQHRIAYGPLIALRHETYHRFDGHAHPSVRGSVVEDLALARVAPMSIALHSPRHLVSYRMYPQGLHQLIEGWTKNTALGAMRVAPLATVMMVVWVFSLCGGAVTSGWLYALSAAQICVIARRVGNYRLLDAVLFPLHTVFFVFVSVRSGIRTLLRGNVTWRGRRIATR